MTRWTRLAAALVDAPSHHDLVVSADGRRIAFTRRDERGGALVLGDYTERGYRLTRWPEPAGTPVSWLDGDRLLVAADRTGGRELHTLTVLDTRTGQVEPVPGSGADSWQVTGVEPGTGRVLAWSTKPHGHSCPDPGAGSMWLLDRDFAAMEPVSCLAEPATTGCWSPDGGLMALGTRTGTGEGLHLVDARTRAVVASVSGAAPAFWHPTKPLLVTRTEAGGHLAAGLAEPCGAHTALAGGDHDEVPLCVDGNGFLLCAVLAEAEVRLVLVELATGARKPVPTPAGVFTDPTRWLVAASGAAFIAGTGRVVTSRSAPRHPLTVVTVDTATGDIDPVSTVDVAGSPATHGPDRLTYPARDGYPVPALLYRPSGRCRGAVVMLHGGPDWLWFADYEPAAQLWAEQGFLVLQPNVRGSAGYGTAHRDATVRDWGGVDLLDVLGAADFLSGDLGMPVDRIGLYGASYGGYLAYLAALSEASPFAATCAWAAPSDLRLLYREVPGQYRAMLRQVLGEPEDDPRWWAQRSPVTHAGQLRGQLLIVQGANDPRTPASQARAMCDALERAGQGQRFELVELDGGHGVATRADRLSTLELVTRFFLSTLPD